MSKMPLVPVGPLQMSRLIVGGNPFSGIAHQTPEVSAEMLEYYTTARIKETLAECERHGINTLVARADQHVMRLLHEYWNEGGKIQWLAQTAPEMGSIEDNIRRARFYGAHACYLQGGLVDQHFERGDMERLRAPLALIRALGMATGIAAHRPQAHLEAQRLELDCDLHMVCFYNLTGHRGRIEVAAQGEQYLPEDREAAVAVRRQLNKPCLAYKIFAAGRNEPRQALEYAYAHIRATDAVVMGVYTRRRPHEVAENVAVALECVRREP